MEGCIKKRLDYYCSTYVYVFLLSSRNRDVVWLPILGVVQSVIWRNPVVRPTGRLIEPFFIFYSLFFWVMQSCDGEREVWYVTVDYAPVVSECIVFKKKRTEKTDGMDENVCSVVMFKNWSFLRYRMVTRIQAV